MSNTLTLPNRDAWKELRRGAIGASEVAAILGVSPWKSSLQLYYEKKGLEPEDKGESFARELGLVLEQPIADFYVKLTRRVVVRPPVGEFWVCRHPTKPHMVATLDGQQVYNRDEKEEILRNRPGVLEIKSASFNKGGDWRQEPPIEYQVQVQHQMACSEMYLGSVVCLIGGVKIAYGDLKRDPEFIALLEGAVDEWWRRFELNDPPPPDGTEATKEFLKRLYPNGNRKSIPLPTELVEYDARRRVADQVLKDAKAERTLCDNMFLAALGDNSQGVLPTGVVYNLSDVKGSSFYVERKPYRQLRRKGPRNEQPPSIPRGAAPKLDIETIQEEYKQGSDREIDADDVFGDE